MDGLSDEELFGLEWLFEFWALPHQLPPHGDWKTWLILGGRGAGKTRAGAEWVRSCVEGPGPTDPGAYKHLALIGETYDQARNVMVFGDSGILECSPPDRRPEWVASRRALVWSNGAIAEVFSAHDPEALRGPQFDAAWCDELGKWKKQKKLGICCSFRCALVRPHANWSYPENLQSLDGISGPLEFRVAQVSSVYGVGNYRHTEFVL